ncbi:TetR/AcrR family transcriptional regulator C-terminal domain-containing protein [Streptomyces sp. NPDC048242]|uniref:TetR/AcrR family transcriptional regulator C-terminal domain-containing protein n=1 Tax=Streptomyces sp. NPDC048242 TaxID=3155026 RepID=UPI00341E5F3E
MATAETFPGLGATWYEQGFERVLDTLAATFQRLADHGLLHVTDARLAADHFSGPLLWIPVNWEVRSADERVLGELRRHYPDATDL